MVEPILVILLTVEEVAELVHIEQHLFLLQDHLLLRLPLVLVG